MLCKAAQIGSWSARLDACRQLLLQQDSPLEIDELLWKACNPRSKKCISVSRQACVDTNITMNHNHSEAWPIWSPKHPVHQRPESMLSKILDTVITGITSDCHTRPVENLRQTSTILQGLWKLYRGPNKFIGKEIELAATRQQTMRNNC